MPKSSDKDNELNDEADNGSKWLNTDSECELLTLSLYIYGKYCMLQSWT
jgi:hypothetical protein